ncbi:MAG: hypothetical protein EOM72_11680 [Opitutae bacterium]|nr:hypothetical protein [Opitutae bacterium]
MKAKHNTETAATAAREYITRLQNHCVLDINSGVVLLFRARDHRRAAALIQKNGAYRRLTRAEIKQVFRISIEDAFDLALIA